MKILLTGREDISMNGSPDISGIFSHDQNFQTIMGNMLQSAFDLSFHGVMITEAGPGFPIVYVNQALCDMTGYSLQELLGQSPALLQGERSDENVLAHLKETIEKGDVFHGQTFNYRKDGSEFMMEWKIVPIRKGDNTMSHFLAIQREIKEGELGSDAEATQLSFGQK